MKKILSFIFILSLIVSGLTGCGSPGSEVYSGKVTDLSSMYLSKGYAVNIYRSADELSDDDFGKYKIKMVFDILPEYTSIADFNPDAGYNIKKMTVTNVRVISTSQMGMVGSIKINKLYSSNYEDYVEVFDKSSKYELDLATPHSSGMQARLQIELYDIALFDSVNADCAQNGNNPTMAQIYNELGITRDSVAIKVGFRIELLTVSGNVLYKEYEIEVPPAGIDIAGAEYHYDFLQADVNSMEPFMEK